MDTQELDHPDVEEETDPTVNPKCIVLSGGLLKWEFPDSQSTLDGRNGSNACSVIVIIFAEGVHTVGRLPSETSTVPLAWSTLLYRSIRVCNRLYDRCRDSLPQRYLSAAEAAIVVEPYVKVSLSPPHPVRLLDSHAPSTLQHHLSLMFETEQPNSSAFIANGKTVLFSVLDSTTIILVDTHTHMDSAAVIVQGKKGNLLKFMEECQNVLGLSDTTFGNIVFLSF